MKMFRRILRSFVVVLIVTVPVTGFGEDAPMQPDEMMRRTTSEVIELLKLKKPEYTADKNKLFAMVDEQLLPYFDFRKMSQLVLGLNWRNANEKQRTEFVEEFKQLLVRTYAVAMLNYTDQVLVFLPYTGKPADKTVVVKAYLKQSSGSPNIPISARFYNGKNGWKVIDVTIEGVSMVTNYRNVYNQTIQNEGLDQLIKSIAASNRDATSSKKT